MAEMTLEEAVRVWKLSRDQGITVNLGAIIQTFAAHAERTIAARAGEPKWLRELREYAAGADGVLTQAAREMLDCIDTLTAENAALRARVEAVRALPRYQIDDAEGEFGWSQVKSEHGDYVRFDEMRDALEGRPDA